MCGEPLAVRLIHSKPSLSRVRVYGLGYVVGGGRDSRPVVVQVFEPRHMVFARFRASSGFFRGLRMHVRPAAAAGRGEGGRGGDSFVLFSRRFSSPP